MTDPHNADKIRLAELMMQAEHQEVAVKVARADLLMAEQSLIQTRQQAGQVLAAIMAKAAKPATDDGSTANT